MKELLMTFDSSNSSTGLIIGHMKMPQCLHTSRVVHCRVLSSNYCHVVVALSWCIPLSNTHFFLLPDFRVCSALLPPASAVEVIESVPSVCLCICQRSHGWPVGAMNQIHWSECVDPSWQKDWGEATSQRWLREVRQHSGVFIARMVQPWECSQTERKDWFYRNHSEEAKLLHTFRLLFCGQRTRYFPYKVLSYNTRTKAKVNVNEAMGNCFGPPCHARGPLFFNLPCLQIFQVGMLHLPSICNPPFEFGHGCPQPRCVPCRMVHCEAKGAGREIAVLTDSQQ